MSMFTFAQANAARIPLPNKSVHSVITSPPYWGLRDYGLPPRVWVNGTETCDEGEHEWADSTRTVSNNNGLQGSTLTSGAGPEKRQAWHDGKSGQVITAFCARCGAWRGCLGLEPTPELYVAHMVAVFRDVGRVLRDDGTLWLNLGDSYGTGTTSGRVAYSPNGIVGANRPEAQNGVPRCGGMAKQLIGIPWRVAFALQQDGWYLRSDIIWCLSGGTWLYAKTQKGIMPMTVKDMVRLDPATVQLWNGDKWTQLLGMSRSHRKGDELELVLRSGERISCTPTHRFPTNRGLLEARAIVPGDVLETVMLPDADEPRDCAIDQDAAWFAGLYIAEGSRSGDKIQIAGHARETERWERCQRVACKFGGSATLSIDGNNQAIRMYGKILNAILDELVCGHTAKDKGFAPVVWRYSNTFIAAMVDGYLSGDGHYEPNNNRWRLGFTRNYNLERDLRTACARLGYHLTLKLASVPYNGATVPTFRGELRKERSGHHNEKQMGEVVEVRKARCREVYDLGVADEPHVFALASGVLSHNSKPNPMPESVTDRPTKAHEYVFMLSKQPRYFYDAEAIREANSSPEQAEHNSRYAKTYDAYDQRAPETGQPGNVNNVGIHARPGPGGRNRRTVWTVATSPFSGAHFATFPPALVEPMILASTSARGCCPKCGKHWVRMVERENTQAGEKPQGLTAVTQPKGIRHGKGLSTLGITELTSTNFVGWRPSCTCDAGDPQPCTILDPFAGSGTTGRVATTHGRRFIGLDLSRAYLAQLAPERMELQPYLTNADMGAA